MSPQGFTLALPSAHVGLRIGLELEVLPEGLRVIVAAQDPRDPLKRPHRAVFVMPTAGVRAAAKPSSEGAPPS